MGWNHDSSLNCFWHVAHRVQLYGTAFSNVTVCYVGLADYLRVSCITSFPTAQCSVSGCTTRGVNLTCPGVLNCGLLHTAHNPANKATRLTPPRSVTVFILRLTVQVTPALPIVRAMKLLHRNLSIRCRLLGLSLFLCTRRVEQLHPLASSAPKPALQVYATAFTMPPSALAKTGASL